MTTNPAKVARVLAACAICLVAVDGRATNGYFTHGVGTHNKALAGAGTASPTQSIDAANNPAAAIMVEERWDAGLSLFSPRRSYNTSESLLNGQFGSFTVGPDDIDSDDDWFPIPYVARNWHLENGQALAFSLYGRGGMNTDYSGGTATFDPTGQGNPVTLEGPFGDGDLGVDLSQAFIELAWAGKVGPLNWGIAPVFVVQRFEAKGIGNFAGFTQTFAESGGTKMPENLSNNGHEWSLGWGAKFGLILEATETLNFALAYQTRMYMTDFEDYADLFAQGGEFDIPAALRAGVSWQALKNVELHADIEHIWFGDIDSIANPINGIVNCPTAGLGGTDASYCLGGGNGIGFGWDDMQVYKVGVDFSVGGLPKWTFRTGYSYGDHPIPRNQLLVNIMAPAVIKHHITLGFSRELDEGREFSMSFMYAPEENESAPSTFDPTQDIEIEMHQYEIEFGYRW